MNEREADALRPRILAVGLTASEIEQIRSLAGTLDVEDSIAGVHAEEYDVLVRSNSDFWEAADAFSRRIVFAPPASDEDEMLSRFRAEHTQAFLGGQQVRATARVQQRPARKLVVAPRMNETALARRAK